MIKVNLLRGAAQKSGARPVEGQEAVASFEIPDFNPPDNSALVQRIVALIIPVILIYAYGWYNEAELKKTAESINQEISKSDAQSKTFGPQLEEISKLTAEKNKLTTQINSIKEVSKNRYGYIKMLDSIQTLIPEKAWITRMVVIDKSISVDGRAVDDVIISTFMQNLEESAYFSNVTWIDSREVNEPQGVVKSFSIKFNLEQI